MPRDNQEEREATRSELIRCAQQMKRLSTVGNILENDYEDPMHFLHGQDEEALRELAAGLRDAQAFVHHFRPLLRKRVLQHFGL